MGEKRNNRMYPDKKKLKVNQQKIKRGHWQKKNRKLPKF
jgi:hypothetical protein